MGRGRGDEDDLAYQKTAGLFGPEGPGHAPTGATTERAADEVGAESGATRMASGPAEAGPAPGPPTGHEAPRAEQRLAPGQVAFGKYLVDRQLGRGGMGTVWLVRHVELDVERALKLIVPGYAIDPEVRARFRREARVMAKFAHPNAVAVHDARLADDVAFIEMEFVRGQPLNRFLAPRVPMPLDWVARILAQLCDVLQLAHDQGIVHRDLKPSNLMLLDGPPPGQEHLKVLDFGIAKILDPEGRDGEDAEERDFRTRPGLFIGTAQYSSPEQAGDGRVDARSDLYSVGVILYELLTGSRPFSGPAVIYNHAATPPPPFAEVNPEAVVPPEVEALVLRCLAKHPDHRPQSARELAEAFLAALPPLDALLAGPPSPEAPTSPAPLPPPDTAARTTVKPGTEWDTPPAPKPSGRRLGRRVALAMAAAVALSLAILAVPGRATRTARPPVGPTTPKIPDSTSATGPATPKYPPYVTPAGFRVADDAGTAENGHPTALLGRKDGARYALVAGGRFRMGHIDRFGTFPGDDDEPAHWVDVPEFYMQESEVTNGQMAAYFGEIDPAGATLEFKDWSDPYRGLLKVGLKEEEARRHPAARVSRRTAEHYARWAGAQLPTEAQWEYAARSRGQERLYVWPDETPPDRKRANIDSAGENPAPNGVDAVPTTEVKSFPTDRTDQGIFDLTGNVREWCRDPWAPYDPARPPAPPPGQPPGFVVRGGDFDTPRDEFRTTGPRRKQPEDQVAPGLGFRLVVESP